MKRNLLTIAVLLFASVLNANDSKPNVILVMCDDLGWGDTGYNGNEKIRTPHLDAMSREGLRMDRYYAAAPVCSPTRGSCLTGRHPFRYGIVTANAGHMKPKELTLAEALKSEGYATGHFGKWHLGTLTTKMRDSNRGKPGATEHFSPPQANGFEVCFSTEAKVPTWDPMRKPQGKASSKGWAFLDKDAPSAHYGTRYWDEKGRVVTDNLNGDNSRIIMDRAVPFVEANARTKKPFFAVIWFHTPHLPVVAGPRHAAMYKDEPLYARNYYGCITAMDEQVGRLRKTLKDAGIAENTMLWFASDNGPEGQKKSAPGSAGPFRGRKRSLYEGGVRVPGLLVWPSRLKAARTTAFPCSSSDYFPTILAAVGLENFDKRPRDGISLLNLIDGKASERDKAIGFQSGGQESFVTQRFKLYRKNRRSADELYDLIDDPSESQDLAASKPDLAKKLRGQLDAWKKSCAASARGADYEN